MSIFPFLSTTADGHTAAQSLPLFREYAYDYENNRLLLRNGNTYLITGNEALKIWIYKALRTARYRFVAYDFDFGSEIHTLIGTMPNRDIVKLELKRFIVEALMVNPYIEELNNFDFLILSSGVTVKFDCQTIYGKIGIEQEMKGVAT